MLMIKNSLSDSIFTGYSPTLRQIITLMVSKDPDYRPNVLQLLSDPSVKCYSWVNLFKDWREYLRSKGLLAFNNVQNTRVSLTAFFRCFLKSLKS